MEWYALLIVLLVGLIASLVQGYSRRKYLHESATRSVLPSIRKRDSCLLRPGQVGYPPDAVKLEPQASFPKNK